MSFSLPLASSVVTQNIDGFVCNTSNAISESVVTKTLHACIYNAQSLVLLVLLSPLSHNCMRNAFMLPACRRTVANLVEKHGKYWRASTPASDGNYGCSVFVCSVLSFVGNTTGAIYIQKDDISIVYGDPRRLLVVVKCANRQSAFVSLHAPYQKAGVDVEGWWIETKKLLGVHLAGIPVFVGVDANLSIPVCDELSLAGLCGRSNAVPKNPNKHSFEFEACIKHHDLTAFGSFFDNLRVDGLEANHTF